MTNTLNFTTYLAIVAASILMSICFTFTLFFIITIFSALMQLNFSQFIVLASFSVVFSIAGSSFLTLTELLYSKVRR
jgi:hypothetical protein